MSLYPAYLEIHEDGRCLGHVLDLPGCVVRAPSRDKALARLPEAIGEYHAWLQRHGEKAPTDTTIEVQVAGESVGFGPFDRRSRAALFAPDRKPVAPEEIEGVFRLLSYSRADLLALVRDLPDEILDWKPHPESFDIRGLLRHVGNAEKWYVSRLVPADTLPPEWQDDEDLSILEFLAMERRTAHDRLRTLSEEQRSTVIYPTAWAYHPEEPWTARKALRRFVEHEREHTWQVREILEARRRWWLARLVVARAELLAQIVGLDTETMVQTPILNDWTVVDVLAHIAAWDHWDDQVMRQMVTGQEPDLSSGDDVDATNASLVAAWRERAAGLDGSQAVREVMGELKRTRNPWLAWLATLSLEEFTLQRKGGAWSFDPAVTGFKELHDTEHAAQIAAWREAASLPGATSPKIVVLDALEAARQELLACAHLVPPAERDTRQVCGEWTLQDVLGHIADWEWLGAEGMRQMAAGHSPTVEGVTDLDAWNRAHVESRRGQPWGIVWDDLHAARRAFLDALENMDQAALARPFDLPWGVTGTPHQWVHIYIKHDREHARDLHAW